jgi:hypothetical protein
VKKNIKSPVFPGFFIFTFGKTNGIPESVMAQKQGLPTAKPNNYALGLQ